MRQGCWRGFCLTLPNHQLSFAGSTVTTFVIAILTNWVLTRPLARLPRHGCFVGSTEAYEF